MKSRNAIIALATSWIGLGESDGSFRPIIDIYNKGRGKCPKMSYTMSWCATTISALAISHTFSISNTFDSRTSLSLGSSVTTKQEISILFS